MRAEGRVRAVPATALEESAEREGASARQLLQAQLHPLRSILDSLTDGVVIVDRAGRVLLESLGAERILGTGTGEVAPEDWPRAFGLFLPDTVTPYPPEDLPLARAVRGETAADVEIFVRGSGRPEGAWISVNGTPWRDPRGRLLGGIAVFREITAHKRADEATQRLSKAVEQTADNVMITDKDGRILYVNPAFEHTTGYGLEEALGQTPRLLKSSRQDPRVFDEMWAALTAGRVFRGTLVNRRKSGVSYYAEQTVTPMRDGAGAITLFYSKGYFWKKLAPGNYSVGVFRNGRLIVTLGGKFGPEIFSAPKGSSIRVDPSIPDAEDRKRLAEQGFKPMRRHART